MGSPVSCLLVSFGECLGISQRSQEETIQDLDLVSPKGKDVSLETRMVWKVDYSQCYRKEQYKEVTLKVIENYAMIANIE